MTATNRSNEPKGNTSAFQRTVRRSDILSDDVRSKALRLFKRGAGYKIVAHVLEINVHTARDWGRRYRKGSFSPVLPAQGFMYDKTVREVVRELREKGLSLREISCRTGVSPSTCSHWTRATESTGQASQTAHTGTGGNGDGGF